jgi:hypothetical protein
MTSQSNNSRRIRVRIAPTPIGAWVAESPDLPGFMVMANNESSLRDGITEQLAATYRAQGVEVDVRPCNADQSLWSVEIRRAIPPSGPNKVGDPEFLRGAGLKK